MLKKKFKKILLLFLTTLYLVLPCYADVMVCVTPKAKISTSNKNLSEGDYLTFFVNQDVILNNKTVIKKGEEVEGLVLEVIPNGWSSTPAKIAIGQFVTKDISGKRLKLSGGIYKTGREHGVAISTYMPVLNFLFFIPTWLLRGGEVLIRPAKDSFILFLKD